jgi:hypothetical protein
MPLQLWIGQGGYFFVDTFLGRPVQVGQAYQDFDGFSRILASPS